MATLSDLTSRHGFAVLEHLEAEADIPVIAGLQRQGDVFVIPGGMVPGAVSADSPVKAVPPAGVPVVEAAGDGRHEHRLYAHAGECLWQSPVTDREGLAVGLLTVPAGGSALLGHAEHGAMLIGPGSYVVRRQREMADQQRLVAD